ncbi:hypothetical protein FNU2_98 [Fusobacterium phage vB_FnuS_FNU2]|nr:hypothetical protein FNU2_98 [Fusobacterium phage vB_FnuS_FNU2]
MFRDSQTEFKNNEKIREVIADYLSYKINKSVGHIV